MRRFLLTAVVFGLLFVTCPAFGQSSSPAHVARERSGVVPDAAKGETVITFSELPVGTAVRNQYADQGIVFAGDSPFITRDRSSPTSPVLSGSPIFQGSIVGRFVRPGSPASPMVVSQFSLDAGYFDALGSVRLQWFDLDGRLIGQRASSQIGIQKLTIQGGGIASWRIEIIDTEPAGFGIDNVRFEVGTSSSLLFREKRDGTKDGTWGFGADEVPGFDHVGLHVDDVVYESHPGYEPGTYTDVSGTERVRIRDQKGVLRLHTRGTFEHDAEVGKASPVIDFDEIPISGTLATAMQSAIQRQVGKARFQYLDFRSLAGLESSLKPSAQKGGLGPDGVPSFTCVGLVEWAAEQAGHREGQGFVPKGLESFWVPTGLRTVREVPLLSPQLLNYCSKYQDLVSAGAQWVQGFFDPVDFLLVDPLGRRLGYTEQTGRVNEIPFAFFSGDGKIEQFLIANPVPGQYRLELRGVGGRVVGGLQSANEVVPIDRRLTRGQTARDDLRVMPIKAGPGDLDGDEDIDHDDRTLLLRRLDSFTDRLGDPGDIDGDGRISDADLRLLERICTRNNCQTESPAGACRPSQTTLCLHEGRFRVEATFEDFQGRTGRGNKTSFQASDSGLFWFFDRDNWEMLVKVLDGCEVNGHYWVFAAATTTVQYHLTVTDTSTGRSRSYFNALMQPSDTITDSAAFATCGRARRPPSASVVASLGTPPITPSPSVQAEPALAWETVDHREEEAGAGCVAGKSRLCLHQGRFRVEVLWRDFEGKQGSGRVVPHSSDDSGLFWFFRSDNWEMLVKVLDGCGVNGRVWVFAATPSNVEYLLRVRDTETGKLVTYYNPPGRSAPAITDTLAFRACPL